MFFCYKILFDSNFAMSIHDHEYHEQLTPMFGSLSDLPTAPFSVATSGDDLIVGYSDTEYITGGAGNDTLKGGEGPDIFDIFEGNNLITDFDFNDGDRFSQLPEGDYQMECLGGNTFITHAGGTNTLLDTLLCDFFSEDMEDEHPGETGIDRKSIERSLIAASSSDDILKMKDGEDYICKAGKGDDIVRLSSGDDVLLGGKGNDKLVAKGGHDMLTAGKGADMLIGGKGNDTLDGGKGDDTLIGGAGADKFIWSQGNDVIEGFNQLEGDRIYGIPQPTDFYIDQVGADTVITRTADQDYSGEQNGKTVTLTILDFQMLENFFAVYG